MAKTFAQIFASSESLKRATRGTVVEAKIISISSNSIIADIGGKSEAIITGNNFSESRDFISTLHAGDIVPVLVSAQDAIQGLIQVSLKPASGGFAWKALINAKEKKEPVKARIIEKSRAGLEVEVMGISSFIPNSHLGKQFQNQNDITAQSINVLVLDANPDRNQLVLSERAISEKDEIQRQIGVLSKLAQGEILDGKVVNVVPFGAFIEVTVGGTVLTGLVHKSEISWENEAELESGADVKVVVLGVKEANLSLSIKKAGSDPWEKLTDVKKDTPVAGRVVRTNERNIMVEIMPGVEGTIARSKVAAGSEPKPGESVNCFIDNVDLSRHRLSLSLQLTAKPIGYK